MKQLSLTASLNRIQRKTYSFKLVHGGNTQSGKRKTARPFIRKKWMHLILKSAKATGPLSLLAKRNKEAVARIVHVQAKKCGAQLKEQVNMGNHVHIKIRFYERSQMRKYLRAVPGLIARHVLGAEKGSPARLRFWDGLAFTRVLDSYNSFRLIGYFRANIFERNFGAEARKTALADLDDWISLMGRPPPHFVT